MYGLGWKMGYYRGKSVFSGDTYGLGWKMGYYRGKGVFRGKSV